MIHGSPPNVSKNRFGRAFICHYVGDSTLGMNGRYYPLTTFDGETIAREWVQGQLSTCGGEDWATYSKLRENWERAHNAASGAGMH